MAYMISCKKIYLCSPDLKPICVLNGLQTNSVNYSTHVKDYSVLTFNVDRFINEIDDDGLPVTIESSGYKDLKIYMYLYLEDIGYFQMQAPKIYGDGNHEYKDIIAYSIEKEFEQKDWMGLKINTGESDSIEYLADNNIDILGFAREYVTLYNNYNHQLSFLHLMIEKCPGWTIGEVDRDIANRRIPYIEVDNTNLYALMTSEVAPRMRILFVFDFLNKRINCYDQDSIDYDTNIYISFRNLANKIELNVDEDSVYTRFRVRGNDDFMLNDVNLNSDIIMDLSYFLGEPYMSEDLADRVRNWLSRREQMRLECADIAMQQAQVNEKLDKLNYTVPSDACLWKNWDNMREDALDKNLEYYQARLRQLRISVDERPDSEKYEVVGDVTTYIPITNQDDEVDDEYYLTRLYNSSNEFKGYYTYLEIITYIIPYIEQAKRNLNLPDDEQIKYGSEAEEDWDLYGYIELEGKLRSYEQDKLPLLKNFEKDWANLTDEGKTNYVNETGYNNAGHTNYLHYVNEIGDENTEGTMKYRLKQLKDEIDECEATLAQLTAERNQLVSDALLENNFNEEEVNLISTLFVDTDYTNSNILVTDIDDVYTTIETEKELYNDSIEMLSRASQPQFKATVELDNLLRLEEFSEWHDDFKLLHFIHVAIREDYSIKLRIIGMTWNPCEITPTLTLEFSNMISSFRGYSDLDDLLNTENFRWQKNSISLGKGGSKTDLEYIRRLIDELQKNGYFTTIVEDEIYGASVSNIDNDYANSLFTNYLENINVKNVNVENVAAKMLVSDSAIITNLFAEKIKSDEVVTNFLEASSAKILNLVADSISTNSIVTKLLQADTAQIENLQTKFITSDIINTRILDANEATIDFLSSKIITADNAILQNIVADQIQAADIIANTISVDKITGNSGQFDQFFINHLDVDKVFGNNAQFKSIIAGEITANSIASKFADFTQANVDILFANEAFINSLQAVSSTTATSVINDAYIYNAVAGKIAVGDLLAGDITVSDNMRIISENGSLIMNGEALQIIGTDSHGDPYVGIQLGYDTNDNPSLIIRNEEGSTILTADGITENAIADGLIINNMIQNGTISKSKLGFSIIEPNQQGGVDITQVYDGSGNQFGVEYTSFKNNVIDDIADINSKKMYRVIVESDNGNIFKNGNVNCTLSCRVFSWDDEITDDINAADFTWTRKSNNIISDAQWNANHLGGSKELVVTPLDVWGRSVFFCTVTLPDGSSETGS